MTTPAPEPSAFDAAMKLFQGRVGVAFLLLVWPVILGGLGLPTGAAEAALSVYLGQPVTQCPVCEPCAAEPDGPVGAPVAPPAPAEGAGTAEEPSEDLDVAPEADGAVYGDAGDSGEA